MTYLDPKTVKPGDSAWRWDYECRMYAEGVVMEVKQGSKSGLVMVDVNWYNGIASWHSADALFDSIPGYDEEI